MNRDVSDNDFKTLSLIKPIWLDWDVQVIKRWLLSKGDRLWTKTGICYVGVNVLNNC